MMMMDRSILLLIRILGADKFKLAQLVIHFLFLILGMCIVAVFFCFIFAFGNKLHDGSWLSIVAFKSMIPLEAVSALNYP